MFLDSYSCCINVNVAFSAVDVYSWTSGAKKKLKNSICPSILEWKYKVKWNGSTQIRYLKFVLNYSTWVNCHIPPLSAFENYIADIVNCTLSIMRLPYGCTYWDKQWVSKSTSCVHLRVLLLYNNNSSGWVQSRYWPLTSPTGCVFKDT